MGMTDSDHHGGTLAAHTAEKVWAEKYVSFFGESVSGKISRDGWLVR